jgi:DNA-binding transcriptional regulator YdaS (Cro superfamily)
MMVMNSSIEPTMNPALEKAIEHFGSLSAMARALQLSGYQVIQEWRRQARVPAEHCPTVERLTGVRCEQLNSRVDWAFLRSTGKTKTAEAA